MATIQEDALAGLEGFSGQLLQPADEEYDEARQIHNGMIDRRPALIARCRGTADVVTPRARLASSGLEVSVRGGGHNVAGKAVTDGGLMIDLAPMKGIHVDPAARTARAQGGVTWAELEPGDAAPRPRRHGRRDLDDRDRGPDTRRRLRVPHGASTAYCRQPPRRWSS